MSGHSWARGAFSTDEDTRPRVEPNQEACCQRLQEVRDSRDAVFAAFRIAASTTEPDRESLRSMTSPKAGDEDRRHAPAAGVPLPSAFDPAMLLKDAPVMISVYEGPEHRFVYSNATNDQAVGHRPLIGLPLREAMPDLTGQGIYERFDRVYASGQSEEQPAFKAMLQNDGQAVSRWYRQSLHPWRDAEGTVLGVFTFSHDITAEVETAELVERRTAELGFALEVGGGVGTWDWDVGNDTLRVNERFAAFFGVPPEQAQGLPIQRFVDAILPEDRDRVTAAIEVAVAEGSEYLQDYRVRSIDGEVRWLTARGRCFYDAERKPARFPGVVIDITRQVDERQELERTYALLKSFLDNSATYVFAKDLEGRYILANRFYLEAFGETEATLYGRTDRDRFGEDEIFSVNDRRVAESGEAIEFEESAVGANGEIIHGVSVKFPLRDSTGKLFGTGSVSADVTARRQTEAALARSEERRLRAMAAGSVGAFEYFPEGRRFVWDNMTASIMGFGTGGTVSLREIARVVHRDDRMSWDDLVARSEATPLGRLELEFRVIRPRDGAVRWIEAVAEATSTDEQESMMVGTVRDVTERKSYEEQLVYLNRELNHRVKNLFAVTRGMIRMAARQEPSAGDFAKRTIARLDALAAAHTIGMDAKGIEPVDLRDMLTAVLRPFTDEGFTQIDIKGPSLPIPRTLVTPLTLTVYELATNAFKHGSLAQAEGRLKIGWSIAPASDEGDFPKLMIDWREDRGKPTVAPETNAENSGFGHRLIDALIVQMSGRRTIEWEKNGLHTTIELELPA